MLPISVVFTIDVVILCRAHDLTEHEDDRIPTWAKETTPDVIGRAKVDNELPTFVNLLIEIHDPVCVKFNTEN
jgi:hypothetical protein